jgi:transcriptional regulator with XRE-family HTH domain
MAKKAKAKVSEDPDIILDQIGRRVIARRQQLGLSRAEFAARLGVTLTNIGRIERGEQNVTVRMMCKVAEALETTVQELMFGAPDAAPRRG